MNPLTRRVHEPRKVFNGFSVIAILFIIQRSKLVLDFVLTLHFIHLILVSLYSHGLPGNWLWWALQICSATFMIVLGTWACQRRELRPIIFGAATSPTEDGSTSRSAGGPSAEAIGDEEAGFSRGGRRGRGRDGAGEYEMLPLKSERQEA
jgi:protein SYS1